MSLEAHGHLRLSQVITTYGPGSLIELPNHSAIVAGLHTWPNPKYLEEISETRLTSKLRALNDGRPPVLYAPPIPSTELGAKSPHLTVWRFPEWFVVQERSTEKNSQPSRRLVHHRHLDQDGRLEKLPVVATRFVRACPRGHLDDLDWYAYVHGFESPCRLQLWLDERGTTGDLSDLFVRCQCGAKRNLGEAKAIEAGALGACSGRRPWLGAFATEAGCRMPPRLLIRTASNAYFPQIVSALSLPDIGKHLEGVVSQHWEDLQAVQAIEDLAIFKRKPRLAAALDVYPDADLMGAIERYRSGAVAERPVKLVELDSILAASEGFDDDVPIDPDFHARKLPDSIWRHSSRFSGIEAIYQLHRLREVRALVGFTRLEPVMPDIQGEYQTDVNRAPLGHDSHWFPAVENRGEGVFLHLNSSAVKAWSARPAVRARVQLLTEGHEHWRKERRTRQDYPGGPYVFLHSLSHLLLQSLSMRCGYPASSIRERIYIDESGSRYGILLFTASPDADGTLGGLVQQARHMESHLAYALRLAALCSNDPICAHHEPGGHLDDRWLQGAACHGCALVAETSCEMRNDHLDRALVVPVLGTRDAAFFESTS